MTRTELKEARERFRMLSQMVQSLTYDSIVKETEEEQEKRVKHLLKPENYIKFFDYYFGIDSGLPLADAPSSAFHQESYMKLYNDPYIVQLRQWFRGAAKSLHTNVGNILHLKENDELNFAVIIGRNEGLAKILLQDLQVHLESNERIIKDFGLQLRYGSWADGDFETTDGKHFKALGLNQPFRGLRFGAARPDFASVDDCEDRDQAKNADMVRKYGDKIVSDLGKAFHFRRGRMVIPNNYIAENGLVDYIIDKKQGSKHLHIHLVNLSDKAGNPSWPERMSRADVERINGDTDYYVSQREDYNNPIEEGKLFKAEEILTRKVHHREAWDGFIAHWDLSYTAMGDHKAGVLLGVQGLRLTVLKVFCQRCDINSAMETHFSWIKELKQKGYSVLSFYDATAAQKEVYGPVILQCAEDNKCPDIPIPMHQEGDKHNRIEVGIRNALTRKILWWDEALGNVLKLPFTSMVLSFIKGVKEDDAPDTLERAITLAQKFFGFSSDTGTQKPIIGKRRTRKF